MNYPIPTVALDDRLAFIGTSGSGKTYNAGVGVERLLASRARVVIVDPLDVWWGLRLRPDGNGDSRFKVVIIGGAHGDLPLTEMSGALIGETVAKASESFIISLGGFPTKAAERRFMLAFLTALYRHTTGEPLHLVTDEADLWAPQVILDKEGDAQKLKGQMEQIVRRGRVKGFIPWLITQRPAVLSKDVLSQADGLVAFKLTAFQDRDALGAWIEGQADRVQGKEILASLPGLQQGQGVVWVPGRGILSTSQFPPKATYDSSRTPKRGEVVRTATPKPLDLGALKDRLATVEAEVKANDPKALKAEVARLKRELATAHVQPEVVISTPDPAAVRQAEQAGYARGKVDGYAEGIKDTHGAMKPLLAAVPALEKALGGIRAGEENLTAWLAREAKGPPSGSAPSVTPQRQRLIEQKDARRSAPTAPPKTKGDGSVPVGCDRALSALASVYPAGMTEAQWATAAGYKRTGGTWGTYKSRLRTAGLIEAREGRWFATEEGAHAAGDVELPPAPGPDLVRWWAAKLPGTTKVAEALIEAGPAGLDRETLAERIGMSAAGGSFGTYLSRLASADLIDRSGGVIRLTPEVMG